MVTFNLDISQVGRKLIRKHLWLLFIYSLPIVIDLIYPNDIIKSSYGYIIMGAFIGSVISDLNRIIVYMVEFDTTNEKIRVEFKSPLGKPVQRVVHFKEARLDFYSKKKKVNERYMR